jgi:serine/threonine protein kinase
MLQGKPYGKAVDWWSVGVLTYEMATKEPPFQHSDQLKLYEKILNAKLKMPYYLSEEIKDFMHCLIQTDLTKR